jgi:hypothetical protein
MPAEPEATGVPRRPSRYGISLVAIVALQSYASFLDGNRSQITQPWRVVAYAVATALLAEVVLVAAVRWSGSRDRDRVAVAVATAVACFLNYSLVFDSNPADQRKLLGVLVVWLLLTVLLTRLMYLAGGNDTVRFGLLIFAVMLLVLPTVSYVSYRASEDELEPVADPGPLPIPAERPNVYWIMLDGYARPDMLERVVGYDDTAFVEGLEDRGFQVSGSSFTSYPRTHLSLSSTLEMDYVLEPGHDVTDDFARFAPVVLGNNATVARFHALGYQTVYGSAGGLEWSACRKDLMDVCLPYNRPSPATGELEQTLLDRTPLGALPLPVPYADPQTFTDGLADPSLGIEEPFFAFQHILTPHFPYRYRDDCTPRNRPVDQRRTTADERLAYYATQVRCINGLVTEAVDTIIERDPTAVILVQSDHGSDHLFTWLDDPRSLTPAQVTERFAAFDAMRLPADCDTDIEGQPLVNTFRIVFACIEGTEPELLDYRGFVAPLDDIGDLSELTPDRFEEAP